MTRPQRDRSLTHLTKKDLITVVSVCVHRVYVIPAGKKEIERDEMIKGQTAADSQKFNKQYAHFFSLLWFPPAGYKQHLKMGLCINFVQTSKMTINKRRPELFALSDRNTQQRFRAQWHRPKHKASLSLREVWRLCLREEGKVETGGAKSLRAVQVN